MKPSDLDNGKSSKPLPTSKSDKSDQGDNEMLPEEEETYMKEFGLLISELRPELARPHRPLEERRVAPFRSA